jgi:inosine-uridine nucleoside N-ribohydrolase
MSQAKAPVRRVIIDTDPGVDDALALLFAMRSPELKIEAVTVVAGNVPVEIGVENALRMVEIAGRADIPVAVGAKAPLERRLSTATSHGKNGLGGLEFPPPKGKPVETPAAELIHRIVSGSPGEVSIVAVGPLTNVAVALRADPSVAKQLSEIVLMGGTLSGGNMTPAAEFNIYVDPEAADVVFSSGAAVTMVGLDVTRKCLLSEEHVSAIAAGGDAISRTAARIAGNDLELFRHLGAEGRAMHDPLAVAVFIDKTLVRLRDYFVVVETKGELTAGETIGYNTAPNARVAVEVDSTRFFRMFTERLSGLRIRTC